MRQWGVRSSRPAAPDPGPVVVVLLGVLALVVVLAAVVLPYLAFLARPDLLSVVAGLTILGCGLLLLRVRAVGPVGWLVYAAGVLWFVPALDVTGVAGLDVAIRCTALLHLALLSHSVVVVGSSRLHGRIELGTAVVGYAVALTAVVGGYRVALPALGVVIAVCVVATGRRLPAAVRAWRCAAGLVLGIGLVVDAFLRAAAGGGAEPWIAATHPTEIALVAVLLAVAGTRPSAWQAIDVRLDGTDSLTGVVAAQLGVADLALALSDGDGGWLRPSGERRRGPSSPAWTVTDGEGAAVAVIEAQLSASVPTAVEHVLRLAAANARLRRSLVLHVEELEQSRQRLLAASDGERAALGAQLRARAIATVAETERELRRLRGFQPVMARARATRQQLEVIARGIDPVATAGSLRGALEEIASTSACDVRIVACAEPVGPDVARALWFCCAEAVANTAKHAPASTLEIRVARDADSVVALLTDDGPGGARATGSGLRGLADRVETLGGRLLVASPAAGGTTLTIELPDRDQSCGQPQPDLRADADPGCDVSTYVRGDRDPGGTS